MAPRGGGRRAGAVEEADQVGAPDGAPVFLGDLRPQLAHALAHGGVGAEEEAPGAGGGVGGLHQAGVYAPLRSR